MKTLRREQFFWEFLIKGKIPSCFRNVYYKDTNFINNRVEVGAEKVIYVSLVPTHLECEFFDANSYHIKKIHHVGVDSGGIAINEKDTIDSFLKKHISRKLRSNLFRTKERLEFAFNITYEYNFGSISDSKCSFLLNELKKMLTLRFEDKNMENLFLKDWEYHTKELCVLINQKKASLFVIYSDKRPISISINTHIENTLFTAQANAFDSDYAKYGLGNLGIFLRLDWCLKNNYKFLDLGLNVMDYKKKWCNTVYDLEYHVFYKKRSLIANVIAHFEIFKIKVKNYIKTKKIDGFLNNMLQTFLGEKNTSKQTFFNTRIIHQSELNKIETKLKEKIDLETLENSYLKRPVFDFLYLNKERIDDIGVFEMVKKKEYFIKGVNCHAIIECN